MIPLDAVLSITFSACRTAATALFGSVSIAPRAFLTNVFMRDLPAWFLRRLSRDFFTSFIEDLMFGTSVNHLPLSPFALLHSGNLGSKPAPRPPLPSR